MWMSKRFIQQCGISGVERTTGKNSACKGFVGWTTLVTKCRFPKNRTRNFHSIRLMALEGIARYPAAYKVLRAGSIQELRASLLCFLFPKYSWYWGGKGVAALRIFTCLSIGALAIWKRLNWQSISFIFCQPWNCHWPFRLMKYFNAIEHSSYAAIGHVIGLCVWLGSPFAIMMSR